MPFLILFLAFLLPAQSRALTVSNEEYKILDTNLSPSESNLPHANTVRDLYDAKKDLYGGTNYVVRHGFHGLYGFDSTLAPFNVSLSSNTVNFGEITPGEPIIRKNRLLVSPRSSLGFQVVAYEDHLLRANETLTIPDTTCDQGNCSAQISAAWISPLTYGFGYRCDNIKSYSCVSDFQDASFYKQFANREKRLTPQVFMASFNAENAEAEITYKINLPRDKMVRNLPQSKSSQGYQNTILYIATPAL